MQQVASHLGLAESHVGSLLSADGGPISLSCSVHPDVESQYGELREGDYGETIDRNLLIDRLQHSLESLDLRERQIIQWRFGLEDGFTRSLQECGDELGVGTIPQLSVVGRSVKVRRCKVRKWSELHV